MDENLDLYNYNIVNNPRGREEVLKLRNEFNLVDQWRIYNDNSKVRVYTWHRKNLIKMARLDFFLMSEEFLALIEIISISNGYRTDHSIVYLEIKNIQYA